MKIPLDRLPKTEGSWLGWITGLAILWNVLDDFIEAKNKGGWINDILASTAMIVFVIAGAVSIFVVGSVGYYGYQIWSFLSNDWYGWGTGIIIAVAILSLSFSRNEQYTEAKKKITSAPLALGLLIISAIAGISNLSYIEWNIIYVGITVVGILIVFVVILIVKTLFTSEETTNSEEGEG